MGNKRNAIIRVLAKLGGWKLNEKRSKKRKTVIQMLLKRGMMGDEIHTDALGLVDIADGFPAGGRPTVASGWGKTADDIGANDQFRKWKLAINRTDEENERDLAP